MSNPIYLDYAATTPVDTLVANEMSKFLTQKGTYGNPSSNHLYGFKAYDAIVNARLIISRFLSCKPKDILFTSGATESNNLAIKGVARSKKSIGNHIITANTEHKAVLDTCRSLENEGFKITYLKPDNQGVITPNLLKDSIKPETILVSIMHVNNETGLVQDIVALGNILKENNILFHVDAAQSYGKIPIDLSTMAIDLLSCSAHKIYGPKGVGLLYVRNKSQINLSPLTHGGDQEFGLRPGTTPTHQIIGLSKATEIAKKRLDDDLENAIKLKNQLLEKITKIDDVIINSSEINTLPNIVNLSILNVESETLVTSLQNDVAISSGSACTSSSIEPSHVLIGMGINGARLSSAIRISFGRYTTESDMNDGIDKIIAEVKRIRSLS